MKETEFQACPFCGGNNTEIRERTYWTGTRSTVLSVEIMHWCDDQKINNLITSKAKTKEEAIEAWNTRVDDKRIRDDQVKRDIKIIKNINSNTTRLIIKSAVIKAISEQLEGE